MTDPTIPTTPAAPASSASASSAVAAPAPAPAAAAPVATPSPAAAPVVMRPTWVPDTHWDAQTNNFNLSALEQDFTSRAALAQRKAEDVKFSIKFPDTVKLPDDYKPKILEPYVAPLQQFALKHGLTNDALTELATLDAQVKLDQFNAETERVRAEEAKLGANAPARKEAVLNWLKGSGLSGDEAVAIARGMTTAAAITALEKIMAKANGHVPATANNGTGQPTTPAAPQKTLAQRWYPNMASSG